MNTLTRSVACLMVGGATVLAVGCKNEDMGPKKEMKKTPMTAPAMKASTPGVNVTPMPEAPMAIKDADMTHVLSTDCPMYESKPMDASMKPSMMHKKGEKVMVMAPGPKYTLVTTVGGHKGFVPTAALKPLGS